MHRTVILVDERDQAIGQADIVDAHTGEGQLHRAFSVYVFRKNGSDMLIQQRSSKKMLWPLFWANTCCSHPFVGEDAATAGQRRLREELGFTCPLTPQSTFVYRAEDPGGRGVEHEHVTILRGDVDDTAIIPNSDEVADWKWIDVEELKIDMRNTADRYAPWFHLGLPEALGRVSK